MELNHVKNVSDGIATVLLYDTIGESYDPQSGQHSGISGKRVAHEIQMLNDFPEVNEIHIRINSSGGSVLDGYSIFSAIMNSKKPVHTFIDGVGASISGIIFQAGKTRSIVDFGRLMIHDPSVGKPIQLLNEKQKNMLESFRDSLMTILENNSNVGSQKLDEIMANETWIKPGDAVKQGFADSIINTGRVSNEIEIMEPDQIMALSNQLNIYKQKSIKMKDLKNHLGIDADSNETQIIESVKAIQNDLVSANNDIKTKSEEIETLKNDVSEKSTEIETLKTENAKHVETLATMHVENAIKNGLFEESQKSDLIEKCKNDMDGFVSILGSIKKQPVKVTNQIDNNGSDVPSLRDLEKTNPSEVQRLINDEPETYKLMYKQQYGVEPKI